MCVKDYRKLLLEGKTAQKERRRLKNRLKTARPLLLVKGRIIRNIRFLSRSPTRIPARPYEAEVVSLRQRSA